MHNSWVQMNCRDPGKRSISIASDFLSLWFSLCVFADSVKKDVGYVCYQWVDGWGAVLSG